jgi:hypothetical protein
LYAWLLQTGKKKNKDKDGRRSRGGTAARPSGDPFMLGGGTLMKPFFPCNYFNNLYV